MHRPSNNPLPPPKRAKQQSKPTGHIRIVSSYPQAALLFASLTFGSWGRTGVAALCCLEGFDPHGNKIEIGKPVPARDTTPPLSLTAPHLLPFSPLSPEEGTSRKRLGKPLDFILLHPLNG